jgi:hypothetical protein
MQNVPTLPLLLLKKILFHNKSKSMKKLKTVLLAFGLCLLGFESTAQLVSVRVNLPAPPPLRREVARPRCPSPDYIWREGHWVWDNYIRDYVWAAGYWEYATPPRPYQEPRYERGRGHGRGHERKERRGRD